MPLARGFATYEEETQFLDSQYFLTVVAAFQLGGGVFPEPTDDRFCSKGSMGTIKLSGKNSISFAESKTLSVRSTLQKYLGEAEIITLICLRNLSNKNSRRRKLSLSLLPKGFFEESLRARRRVTLFS